MTFGKRDAATVVAEFLGTGVLTLLILSVQRSSIGVPFFVALAAGLAVAVMSFAVAGTSGGYFNPALTIGMWTTRKLSTLKMVAYVIVQLLGGLAAYYVYTYFVDAKLQSLHGHFVGRILLAEAIGAGIFAFGWASMAYQRSRFSPAAAASVAGLALSLGIIAASPAATATMPAGLLNPAVALGAKAWVWGTYVLGPVVGALVGANLYAWLFAENGTATAKAAVASPVAASKPTPKRKTTRAKK